MKKRYGPWPTERDVAAALGMRHYFTGLPCKRGHVDVRITATRNCLSCKREAEREQSLERLRRLAAAETPEQRSAKQARYREVHRGQRNAKKREAREFERFMRQMQDGTP